MILLQIFDILSGGTHSPTQRAMGILELFGIHKKDPWEEPGQTPSETVRKITEQLDKMDRDQARYIAAYAYVLGARRARRHGDQR